MMIPIWALVATETAIAFWTLLLEIGLSGAALPRNGWRDEYTQWWFEYLTEKGGKGVSKDTWAMVRLRFIQKAARN
jgi:DCN1-like protein 1/2